MNSLLTLSELLKAVNGKNAANTTECYFSSVQTDSRNVVKDTMFVPLIGEFQDGHKYVRQAIEKGASVILVDEYVYETKMHELWKLPKKYPFVTIILVKNTLHALQDAAEAYVEKMCGNMTKISITGSSGKTTTKELMVSVCKEYFGEENVAYTKGNFNSETGLPLSVFTIKGTEKVGVFEMGMNRENEIGEISKVYKSQYGIITNIGTAHIGILGSRENIAKEKRKSFDYIPADGAVFVPACDDFADYVCENVKGKIIKYGKSVDEKISGVKFISSNGFSGTKFLLDGTEINLPLAGEYNFENCLGIIACAREIGVDTVSIKNGIEKLNRLDGRMENINLTLSNGRTVTLLKDCYNANLDSMSKAIEFVCKTDIEAKKILVLADMKELGESSRESHEAIGRKIMEGNPDAFILIGPEMENAYNFIKNNNWEKSVYYLNCELSEYIKEAGELILDMAADNDIVLLKGSHSMSLEKIITYLEGGKNGIL